MYNELESANQNAQKLFDISGGNDIQGNWLKWFHKDIPDEPEWFREMVRMKAAIFGHCFECTALSGCYFFDAKAKIPEYPHHEYCHCELIGGVPKVKAFCPIEKFTDYIFSEKYKYKGKKVLFENLGFTAKDSASLKDAFEKAALSKYQSGNYTLGLLNGQGQRINIEVVLPHDTRGSVSFMSGWMVRPKGYITCNTPLGG